MKGIVERGLDDLYMSAVVKIYLRIKSCMLSQNMVCGIRFWECEYQFSLFGGQALTWCRVLISTTAHICWSSHQWQILRCRVSHPLASFLLPRLFWAVTLLYCYSLILLPSAHLLPVSRRIKLSQGLAAISQASSLPRPAGRLQLGSGNTAMT